MFKKKNKELTEEEKEVIRTKSFFDMILPSTIKFSTEHYVCCDSYRCVWAIKEYPPTTEELALFSTLADRNNLTIHLYSRMVDAIEQRKSYRMLQEKQTFNRFKRCSGKHYSRGQS